MPGFDTGPVRTIVDRRSEVDAARLSALTELQTHTAEAVTVVVSYGQELVADLGCGVVTDAVLFDWVSQGDPAVRRDRYATVRTLELFRVRAIDRDPLAYPEIRLAHDDRYLRRRPLQPTEIGLVRLAAIYLRNVHVASVAVLDAGGTAGDYPGLGPDRVVITDLDHRQGFFMLGGTTRISPRTNPIPSWAFDRIVTATETVQSREAGLGDRHLPHVDPSICTGSRKHRAKVESAALMNVRTVLDVSGLRQDPTVEPASIRNTQGRHLWQTHSLEEAARRLGVNDFNSLRREIGAAPHKPIQKRQVPSRT